LKTKGHGPYTTEKAKSQLRRGLLKAASELRLHYFLCRISTIVVVRGLTNKSIYTDVMIEKTLLFHNFL